MLDWSSDGGALERTSHLFYWGWSSRTILCAVRPWGIARPISISRPRCTYKILSLLPEVELLLKFSSQASAEKGILSRAFLQAFRRMLTFFWWGLLGRKKIEVWTIFIILYFAFFPQHFGLWIDSVLALLVNPIYGLQYAYVGIVLPYFLRSRPVETSWSYCWDSGIALWSDVALSTAVVDTNEHLRNGLHLHLSIYLLRYHALRVCMVQSSLNSFLKLAIMSWYCFSNARVIPADVKW